MSKFQKYLSIIVPFFFAIGIHIGTGIIGGLLHSLIYLIFSLLSRWEFTKSASINKILDIMITKESYFFTILTIISAIICIIIFYFWYRKYNPNNLKTEIYRIRSLKSICLLFILSLSYSLFEIGTINLIATEHYNIFQNYVNMVNQFHSGNQIIRYLYSLLIAPISEELIFRGMILTKASKELTFLKANILQSVLFGLYHMNIIQGVYTFIAGLLLGYIAFKFKTIMASIILHSFLNLNLGRFFFENLYPSKAYLVNCCLVGLVLFLIIMRIIKKQNMYEF